MFKNGVSRPIFTARESSDLGLAGFLGNGGDSHGWHSRQHGRDPEVWVGLATGYSLQLT